jgi:hypothetical protein
MYHHLAQHRHLILWSLLSFDPRVAAVVVGPFQKLAPAVPRGPMLGGIFRKENCGKTALVLRVGYAVP